MISNGILMVNRDWQHMGISQINQYKRSNGRSYYRVRLPDEIIDSTSEFQPIAKPGRPVYWSFETVSGTIVISDTELDDKNYEFVNTTDFGGDSNNRTTVPKEFIEPHPGKGSPQINREVADEIRVEADERLHFMYHSDMRSSSPRSCYALTDNEFQRRFNDSEVWNGSLDQVPKFV